MPAIEILEDDVDSAVEFTEPACGESGFHSIAISPPQPSSEPASLFVFGGKLAQPVEPGPESFHTPPTRRSSLMSMSSQDSGIKYSQSQTVDFDFVLWFHEMSPLTTLSLAS